MYIDDPIGRALGLPPLEIPIEYGEPEIEPFNISYVPPWNKGLTGIGGYTLSAEHKKNISKSRLYNPKCTPSPELRKQVSAKLKGRTDYMKRGAEHYMARKVLHVESNTIYGSIGDAARAFAVSGQTVIRWCNAEQEGRVISRNKRTNNITLRYYI